MCIMESLVVGNSAKQWCLDWIEKFTTNKQREISILDLGCGEARYIIKLLQLHPEIRYIGIEPYTQSYLRAQANLKGLNANVVSAYSYDVHEILREDFDIVISFSVFEHVYRREEYLRSAKDCLKKDGYFLINYDSGHFRFPSAVSRFKDVIRSILAYLGIERYYQSFVKENHFRKMIDEVGFTIIDDKFFNVPSLKGISKVVPRDIRFAYMQKWVEFELLLNELEINYTDSFADLFGTRNFILVHKHL